MKKKILLLLVLIPVLGYSQPSVNRDSLLYYFTKIINDYRSSNGLETLSIDTHLKLFTDEWSMKMGEMNRVGHGEGSEHFRYRVAYNEKLKVPGGTKLFENCTELMTPDVTISVSVQSYPELIPYINRSYAGKLNQYEYAYYAFLMWKNSPPHNGTMLSPYTKYFYLSPYRKHGKTFLCYIARS